MTIIKSHGSGEFKKKDFAKIGKNVVIERNVLVFHPENIEIGDDVYIGHQTILKGYHKNKMIIGSGSWIGQQCFFHSAGGIDIQEKVGIGPGVKILTSTHELDDARSTIIENDIICKKVTIGRGSDIGVNAVIMPGVSIGQLVQIGAGSVVTKNVPSNEVWAGVPAKKIRKIIGATNKAKKR